MVKKKSAPSSAKQSSSSSSRTGRRRASNNKNTTANTEEDDIISSSSKRPKSTLSQLYRDCIEEVDDSFARHRAWSMYVQQGALSDVLWPIILQHTNTETNPSQNDESYHQACLLWALLVSVSHSQGQTPSQILSHFLQPEQSLSLELWNDCLTTMIQPCRVTSTPVEMSSSSIATSSWSVVDWEYMAAVTHTLNLIGCECSSSSASTTIWLGWKQLVLGSSDWELWTTLPTFQREYLFRKHQIEVVDQVKEVMEVVEGSSNKLPFVALLVQHLLSLWASDDLKVGQIRFVKPDPNDEENDDENEIRREIQTQIRTAQWMFVHRAIEALLDWVSHPFLRLWIGPYLTAMHLCIHAKKALGIPSPISQQRVDSNWYLAQQLIRRLERTLTVTFEYTTPEEILDVYHRRAITLQKMCHRFFPDALADLIYAGAGTICQDRTYLRSSIAALNDLQLLKLLHKMHLVGETDSHLHDRDFLQAVLEEYVLVPIDDPMQELQSAPLYPTETMLWDLTRIPPSMSSLLPASQVLALPKLLTNFVSFAHYLSTNFELTQASSAHDIRVDLVDVIRRVKPLLRQQHDDDMDHDSPVILKTELTGWARMALEVHKLDITRVQKPHWGESHPAQVMAELVIDLKPFGDAIRREWDELGEFDNLFLVAIDAAQQSGRPAPLLREYHLQHGTHVVDSDHDRRVPDEDDQTFPQRFGATLVRGCTIVQVRDEQGSILSDPGSSVVPSSTKRIFRIALDPTQYAKDFNSPKGTNLYKSINLVVRRHGRENSFKAELETIRGLLAGAGSITQVLPTWLQPIVLGHGDPTSAHYNSPNMQHFALNTVGVPNPEDPLDFGDTFVSEQHLRSSFGDSRVLVDGRSELEGSSTQRRNYRIRILRKDGKSTIEASSYAFRDDVNGNPVPFTPVQVEAIRSGLAPGLAVVVGPPGTGKTDVAVQIISCLFHSFPTQRTIVITHSNAALNDIFQKVMHRGDVDERYLVRLGAGEHDLETDSSHDFTKLGRVSYSFHRRGILLEEVQKLSESLGISSVADRGDDGSPSYTCETAEYFRRQHILKRIQEFNRGLEARPESSTSADDANIVDIFPFADYFGITGRALSAGEACDLVTKLDSIFSELAEYRPLELLRSQRQRTDYIIMKQARVVAMTCTHAAMVRSQLLEIGFHYDNIVVEEAGQMTEIENFIPFLLQQSGAANAASTGQSRLKRVCLMGDHNQLPPVIKNMTFAHYCNLDRSMFARLIRLGVSYLQLDQQGRARPEIARLYSWRYHNLGNLDDVVCAGAYRHANAGFVHTVQVINVDKFQGKGEQTPTAYFYQNVGEAEYAVALFQFMVLIGYPPSKISILTTYNGQKALISDVLSQRCGEGTPLAGVRPRTVSTVDKYQGQQNDYIILSLVRTESVGHLRDVRRLVVAVSRSRLGLYILCRHDLFAACHDLHPTFDQLSRRRTKLQLLLDENYPTERLVDDTVPEDKVFEVEDVTHLGTLVYEMQETMLKGQ